MKSPITTHVLDTAQGCPAAGIRVVLARRAADDSWHNLADGITNADGRIGNLLEATHALEQGRYRLTFEVGSYFATNNQAAFYEEIPIHFRVDAPGEHYHVPLLLAPYSYATYRGS